MIAARNLDDQVGVPLAQAAEVLHEVAAEGLGDGEAHRPLDPVVATRQAALDRVEASLDLFRQWQDPASRLCRDQTVGAAEKEPRAQLRLEGYQAASHRRVLDAELAACAREASRPRDRQEVTEIIPVGHPCRFARWVCRFNHFASRV